LKPEIVHLNYVDAVGGGILKILSSKSASYCQFGELYFSELDQGIFRGWKLHTKSDSFLFVIRGEASIHIVSSETTCETINLTEVLTSQCALWLPHGITFGFKSVGTESLIIANFASEEYSSNEVERPELNFHTCDWTL